MDEVDSRVAPGGRTLVLGGGGLVGGAWEIGLLAGLDELGLRLTDADTVIGTSAGAVVGAEVTSAVPISDLYEQYLAEDLVLTRVRVDRRLRWAVMVAMLRSRDPVAFRRYMGRAAARLATTSEAERKATLTRRLPTGAWPRTWLLITAVDADTGQAVTFDRTQDVALADAVTASCAAPGLSPPITVGARRFIDGGIRSFTNADLATGSDRVVVLAPLDADGGPWPTARTQIDTLIRQGAKAALVTPDPASRQAIGPDALDPNRRAPAAKAGHQQARTALDQLAPVLANVRMNAPVIGARD